MQVDIIRASRCTETSRARLTPRTTSSQWGVSLSYCNSTRQTIAKPARRAEVLDEAFSWALLRSYSYFSAIDNAPFCSIAIFPVVRQRERTGVDWRRKMPIEIRNRILMLAQFQRNRD
ncbi:hypothetical protein PMAYCL1PPCAC_16197, partial [Pristionchus mayeri]